jgi:PAS domain S-box-containing protein
VRPARILVLEDDRVVARDIQQQLQRIGHEVLGMAVRGEDAVALALQTQPDLVLMDIRLEGEIDGVEAANQIRERCQSPVVFLTAYSDDETVRRASQAEPFGFLLKPFEDSQLRTAVEMALYKHAAERKLRESERRFATTLSSIGDAVIATDRLARVTFLNPVAVAMTGWTPDEALGRPISEIFHILSDESGSPLENPAMKALQLGTTVGLANHSRLVARNGRELLIDDCSSLIIDARGETTGAVLVFRDVTRRHKLDAELREAQAALSRVGRLTVMGELTASIAHELNQPLTAIVANAAACVRWLADDDINVERARHAAQGIVKDGQRAGDIIASIRALSRKSATSIDRLDINAAILEVLVLLRSELRYNGISSETALAHEAQFALGDRVQIQQVLINLVMNSIDALKEAHDRTRLLQICTLPDPPDNLLVSIVDTGAGLDPGTSEKIFDAFYTTKAEGIGMGLSICRSIVEAHGGRLWASPNRPHGCTFQFTIPVYRGL